MTRLLETAVDRIRALPDAAQDRLAQLLLDEIESSRQWDDAFSANPDALEKLAQRARERDAAGESTEKGWDEL